MTLQEKDLNNVGNQVWNQIANQAWHQIRLQAASKPKAQVINQCWNEVNYKVSAQVNGQVNFKLNLELKKNMILQEKDLKNVGNKVCRQGGAEVWNQVIKRVETQVMIRASWYEVWWQIKSKINKL